MTELYQRGKKFIKLKGKKLSKFYNKRIYKVIFIFFSFNIIFYSYYISPNDFFIFSFLENDEGDTNDSNDINETNNYWFKNKTKFINILCLIIIVMM